MRKKTSIKWLLSAMLVLAMVFSLTVPVFADDAKIYTVTITPSGNEATPDSITGETPEDQAAKRALEGRYKAFEIFSGTVADPSDNAAPGGSYGYDDPGDGELTGVKWGSSVKTNETTGYQALLQALLADGFLGTKIGEYLKAADYEVTGAGAEGATIGAKNTGDSKFENTAAIVSNALSYFTKNNEGEAAARAFAKVVSDFVDTAAGTSTWVNDHWEIKPLGGGYYLIKDEYVTPPSETGTAESDFVLVVAGDVEITPKSSIPTVEKTIVESKAAIKKGIDQEIGKRVTFQLEATLPENIKAYEKYYLAFHDKLSAGLTYAGNIDYVYIQIDNDYYMIESGWATPEPTDGHTLDVVIDDLLSLSAKKIENINEGWDLTNPPEVINLKTAIKGGAKVYVQYQAIVNDEADITINGNTNTVHLEYSNEPTDNGHGNTTEKKVWVYDFGLDLEKYDTTDSSKILEAGFTVQNEDDAYAIFEVDENGEYILAGWVDKNTLETLISNDTEGTNGWRDVLTDKAKSTFGADKVTTDGKTVNAWLNEAYKDKSAGKTFTFVAMTKDTNGKSKLHVKGFNSEGEYTLTETIVPGDYDPISPIEVTYQATYWTDQKYEIDGEQKTAADFGCEPGQLKDLTATIKNLNGVESQTVTIVENGSVASGTHLCVDLGVGNTPTGYLPGTGGIGTYLFYIGGGILLVGAALCLVVFSRKKSKGTRFSA